MLDELREAVARTARELSAAGQVVEAQGNVSARSGELVAVTAKGAQLGAATAADVSVVALDGAPLEGPPPSSELKVHLGIYAAFPDAGAVVHGHALPSAGAAPVAAFAPEGSQELADAVVEAMRGGARLVVMERHGTVARGATLEEALATSSAVR